MATMRTMKLNLLADVDKFGKGLDKAGKDAQGFGNKVSKYGKLAAGAFVAAGAAAGAMAIKIGIDAVKAAQEDEKSSRILAIQLQKTVGANEKLTASVEDYISQTQLRVGIQDDKLRPSFARLLRSTKDVTKAQELLNLAIDISTATGKDLDTVSAALGKGYDGNAASLGRLGLGIDTSILKQKDFTKVTDELRKSFGGFADKESKSFDGQLRILNIRVDEFKESIGKRLLPILSNLFTEVTKVAKAFSGEDPDGLSARARELKGEMGDGGAGSLGRSLAILADSFGKLFAEFSTGKAGQTTSIMQQMADALISIANAINLVATAFKNYKKFYDQVPQGLRDFMNPLARLNGYADMFGGGRASGGSVSAGRPYRVGEFGSEIFVPNGVSGSIRKDTGGGGNTFVFNGVIDGESARRSIEKLLQNSARRTGAVSLVGATL